ncbi:MAG: uL22 family ribosomal protein [Candidatus Pacearchaeota archaeon]|jgi:ribosomal protein L22
MADEQLNQLKIVKEPKIRAPKKQKLAEAPKEKEEKIDVKENVKVEEVKTETSISKELKEKKESKDKKVIVKKSEAMVYGRNLQISKKQAIAIGRFIKYKKIPYAIELLEKVVKQKLAVPMKGELPHRKGKTLDGKSMMSGRYPVTAAKEFIRLLKNLSANSNVNGLDLEKTIIFEVVPNKAPKQFHRFGSTQFKRTHVTIKSKELGEKKKQ